MVKGKANCIADSDFKRLTTYFFKAKQVTYPLTAKSLARLICESGTHSRENSLGLIDLFRIELKERTKFIYEVYVSQNWFATLTNKGNAYISYPPGQLIVEDFELDNLELEHEFGHLMYWGMMNYLGKGRLKSRNQFEEDYAKKFALELRAGER